MKKKIVGKSCVFRGMIPFFFLAFAFLSVLNQGKGVFFFFSFSWINGNGRGWGKVIA